MSVLADKLVYQDNTAYAAVKATGLVHKVFVSISVGKVDYCIPSALLQITN